MSCCSKIGDILRKVLDSLGPIISIALLCVAAYFLIFAGPGAIAALEGFTFLPASLTTLTLQASTWGYLALGAAVIIDPAFVAETAGTIAKSVGNIAGAVVSGLTGGLVSGLFGGDSFLPALVAGGLIWFFFFRKKDNESDSSTEPKEPDKIEQSPVGQNPVDDGFQEEPMYV